MGIEFKKATPEETEKLRKALRDNVEVGKPIQMASLDTSFTLDEQQIHEDMINAIRSVPCHY